MNSSAAAPAGVEKEGKCRNNAKKTRVQQEKHRMSFLEQK